MLGRDAPTFAALESGPEPVESVVVVEPVASAVASAVATRIEPLRLPIAPRSCSARATHLLGGSADADAARNRSSVAVDSHVAEESSATQHSHAAAGNARVRGDRDRVVATLDGGREAGHGALGYADRRADECFVLETTGRACPAVGVADVRAGSRASLGPIAAGEHSGLALL